MIHNKKSKNTWRAVAIGNDSESILQIFKQIFHMATLISSFDLKLSFFGNQIKASACDVSARSTASAAAAEEISSSATELASSNDALSHVLQQIAQETTILNQNTLESNRLLQSVYTKNHEVIGFSEQLSGNMKALSEAVSKVEQVIGGINQISTQTKLLALNASIEAAHVGAAGSGFGVVAGEIKQLSESTGSLTSSIEELLHEIQTALEQSSHAADQAAEAINQVGDDVDSVVGMMKKNTDAVVHISGSISQAASSSESVNAALQESTAALETVNADLQTVAALAVKMSGISSSIGELSGAIQAVEEQITEAAAASGVMVSDGRYPLTNEDFIRVVQNAIQAHRQWVETVSEMACSMKLAPLQMDEHKCGFGHFYFAVTPSAQSIAGLWKDIDGYHHDLHHKGESILRYIQSNHPGEAAQAAEEAKRISMQIIGIFEEIIQRVQLMNQSGLTVF